MAVADPSENLNMRQTSAEPKQSKLFSQALDESGWLSGMTIEDGSQLGPRDTRTVERSQGNYLGVIGRS